MGGVVKAIATIAIGVLAISTGGILGAAIGLIGNFALSAFSKPKPPQGVSREPKDRKQILRSSVQPQRVIYGRAKVSGVLCYTDDFGEDNKNVTMVLAVAGHPSWYVSDFFSNDKFVTDESISEFIETDFRLGSTGQTGFNQLSADSPLWTSSHVGRGITSIYGKFTFERDKFPSLPGNFGCIVKGKKVFDPRHGQSVWSRNPAVCMRDYLISEYGAKTSDVDDTYVIAAANICDETVAVINESDTVSEVILSGNSLTRVNNKLNFQDGDGVHVTSSGSVPGGIVPAQKYFYVYLSDNKFGLATSLLNAQKHVLVDITSVGSGTIKVTRIDQQRYSCDGSFTTDQKPVDIINEMLTSMGGMFSYVQGKFRIFAASSTAHTATIDETWLRGSIKCMTTQPRNEIYNAVKGVYVDPSKFWQQADFPHVTNNFYQEQDGGDRIFQDIDLTYTTDSAVAQRIARIQLEKSRQAIQVEMECNQKGMDVTTFDTVLLNIDKFGFTNKKFRVMNWSLDPSGGINLSLQEEADAAYDWNSGLETKFDLAPNTNLGDPFTISPPGIPKVIEKKYSTGNGTSSKFRAAVSWSAPANGFVARYRFEHKLSTEEDWVSSGDIPGSVTTAIVNDLDGGIYDFRVFAINSFGVESEPSTRFGFEMYQLNDRPGDIQGFFVNFISGTAHLSWVRSADEDVISGGSIRLRFTPDAVTPSWDTAIDLGPSLSGSATNSAMPALPGTYLIKAVDAGGIESLNASTFSKADVDIIGLQLVQSQDEQPTFPGTKSNLVVNGSILNLKQNIPFDEITGLFDSQQGIFTKIGDTYTSGTYTIASPIDLGSVQSVRALGSVKAKTTRDPVFDNQIGLFDLHFGLFSGVDITGGTAKISVRTTNDDPGGSPTWSDWEQFYIGDYSARAFDFRVEFATPHPDLNMDISEIGFKIYSPEKVDSAVVATSAGGSITVNYNKVFNSVASTGVSCTIQDAQSGDYVTVTAVTNTGFDIVVRDSVNAAVVRNVYWQISGF